MPAVASELFGLTHFATVYCALGFATSVSAYLMATQLAGELATAPKACQLCCGHELRAILRSAAVEDCNPRHLRRQHVTQRNAVSLLFIIHVAMICFISLHSDDRLPPQASCTQRRRLRTAATAMSASVTTASGARVCRCFLFCLVVVVVVLLWKAEGLR